MMSSFHSTNSLHLIISLVILTTLHGQQIQFPGQSRRTTEENLMSCTLDNCRSGGNSRDVLSVDHRSCQCDDLCWEHGDCCLDAPKYDANSAYRARHFWKCTELRNYYGIFLKVACPSEWQDHLIRDFCESSSKSEEDPLRKLPVTSRLTQLTYKNYYCAVCNNDMSSPIYWISHLECGDRSLELSFGSVNFWDTIEFNKTLNSWGFFLRNGSFISCTIDAQMPQTVFDLVRRCVPYTDECHSNWTNVEIRQRCYSYTEYVYHENEAFRNRDCAVCNYVRSSLQCKGIRARVIGGEKFNSFAFTMLFDVNERQGNIVGNIQHCAESDVYDPFARRCRSVFCGRRNQFYKNGACVGQEEVTESAIPTTTVQADVVVFPLDEEVWSEDESGVDGVTHVADVNASERIDDVLFTFDGDNIDVTGSSYINDSSTFDCEKFVYNESDFLLFENGSVYLKVYKRVLLPKDFQQDTNKIYVCIRTVLGDDFGSYSNKFSAYLSIVSIVGLGISLICLFIHLICFILVSDLQNLSGKNLASLCIALTTGYIMFIVAQFSSISKIACSAVGVAMFYGFLSSFFWMNTMAFDVWRALRQATKELRVSSGQQWRKFIVYSAYSWLSPALIVGVSVIVENINSIPQDFRPGFGLVLCWFSHRRALLLFFVVPVVTVILINIVLFSFSALMIVGTTKNAAKLHSTSPQRNFRLYLRLASLMGLTWVVGIIAALSDVEPLWHIFVIFNTLQGLFIFFAFTCTKKVLNSLFNRVNASRSRSGRKSSTFVGSYHSDGRNQMKRKSGLEARDSADSHTSKTSLTQTTSAGSIDTLY